MDGINSHYTEDWMLKMKERAEYTEKLITSLTQEVDSLKYNFLCQKRIEFFRKENLELIKQIDEYRQQLIILETENGIQQVSLPGIENSKNLSSKNYEIKAVHTVPFANSKDISSETASQEKDKKLEKQAKRDAKIGEKKVKEIKGTDVKAEEPPIDIGRLDLRIGKIVTVKKHPDADSLYVEEIDVGENVPRTVVSGLVKYVPIEEMQGRMVVVLCNLKPAKMRGITSQAMVMCASSPEAVEILQPPPTAIPGDVVNVDGYPRSPDAVLNPKKKIFESVAPDLKTNNEFVATYKGVPWMVSGKGLVKAQGLSGVNIK